MISWYHTCCFYFPLTVLFWKDLLGGESWVEHSDGLGRAFGAISLRLNQGSLCLRGTTCDNGKNEDASASDICNGPWDQQKIVYNNATLGSHKRVCPSFRFLRGTYFGWYLADPSLEGKEFDLMVFVPQLLSTPVRLWGTARESQQHSITACLKANFRVTDQWEWTGSWHRSYSGSLGSQLWESGVTARVGKAVRMCVEDCSDSSI